MRFLERFKERFDAEKYGGTGNRKGWWTIVLVLVLMVGWTVSAQVLLPRSERKAGTRAINYTSTTTDFLPPPEPVLQSQAPPPRPNVRPAPPAAVAKPAPARPKRETEEQKMRRRARLAAHYAGPFGEAWRMNAGTGHNAQEREPQQTLEVPAARQVASNQRQKEDETKDGDVWRRDFFERTKGQTGVLQPARSPYMVMRGTVLPVELLTSIDTQTPGQVTAVVTQDIRDTATGQFVLIPKDTVLVGGYDTTLAYDQNKLPTSWDQMNFPNGETMQLAALPGADGTGAAGMNVKVNTHFWKTTGRALMLTLSGAVARAGSQATGSSDFQDALQQQGGRQVDQATRQQWARGGYKGPTGTAQAGTRFLVQVTESMIFPPGDYYERVRGAYAEAE